MFFLANFWGLAKLDKSSAELPVCSTKFGIVTFLLRYGSDEYEIRTRYKEMRINAFSYGSLQFFHPRLNFEKNSRSLTRLHRIMRIRYGQMEKISSLPIPLSDNWVCHNPGIVSVYFRKYTRLSMEIIRESSGMVGMGILALC